jgi:hypothetical protein
LKEEAALAEDSGPLRAERDGGPSTSASLAQGLMSRARLQLSALRSQVQRLNVALTRSEAAKASLDRDRAASRVPLPLAQPVRGGAVPAEPGERLVSFWLNDAHVRALVEAGLLDPADAWDRVKVARALRGAMDRWSRRTPTAPRLREEDATGAQRGRLLAARVEAGGDDRIIRLEAARAARTAARLATAANVASPRQRPHGGPLCGIAAVPPQRLGLGRLSTAGAAAQDAQRIDRERQPDEGKRGQVNRRERLAVDEDREQEVPGGRDVLQQPDRGQADPLRPGDEQQQR